MTQPEANDSDRQKKLEHAGVCMGLMLFMPVALDRLKVRPVLAHRLWAGGSYGRYTPKRAEWQTPKVAAIAQGFEMLLANNVEVGFVASGTGMPRRSEASGRWSDLYYLEDAEGGPIDHAKVVGVTHVDVGKSRSLPILKITDNNMEQSPTYGLTIPDLAHYHQNRQVRFEASLNV